MEFATTIFRNIKLYCQNRNLEILDDIINLKEADFIYKLNENELFEIPTQTNNKSILIVIINANSKKYKKILELNKKISRYLAKPGLQELIIVLPNNWINLKAITPYSNLYIFPCQVFYTNPIEHCSYQKHEIMDNCDFLTYLHLTKNDLPSICELDPQILWIGGKKGDIIRITRSSNVAGFSYAYKLVI